MRRFIGPALFIILAATLTGCGSSDNQGSKPTASIPAGPAGQAGDSPAEGAESKSAVDLRNLNPQQLVTEYLHAVKAGDEQLVSSMLTQTARRKTNEANIAVAPPGSETADFSVGDMEFVTPDKKTAHVASIWTDKDEQGKPQSLRIVWVVRQETEGWRIAGMVTRLSANQPLLVLDFENPEEVIRKQATAQDELSKRKTAVPPTSAQNSGAAGNPPGSGAPPLGAAMQQAPLGATLPPADSAQNEKTQLDPTSTVPNPVREARNPGDEPKFLPR